MARDCVELSAKAQEIFARMQPYFPPDPWNTPRWMAEGMVHDNGWYDLRLAADRTRLEEKRRSFIGSMVVTAASSYREKTKVTGSLAGFSDERFSFMIQHEAELLLLLQDLDFQIETGDLVGM